MTIARAVEFLKKRKKLRRRVSHVTFPPDQDLVAVRIFEPDPPDSSSIYDSLGSNEDGTQYIIPPEIKMAVLEQFLEFPRPLPAGIIKRKPQASHPIYQELTSDSGDLEETSIDDVISESEALLLRDLFEGLSERDVDDSDYELSSVDEGQGDQRAGRVLEESRGTCSQIYRGESCFSDTKLGDETQVPPGLDFSEATVATTSGNEDENASTGASNSGIMQFDESDEASSLIVETDSGSVHDDSDEDEFSDYEMENLGTPTGDEMMMQVHEGAQLSSADYPSDASLTSVTTIESPSPPPMRSDSVSSLHSNELLSVLYKAPDSDELDRMIEDADDNEDIILSCDNATSTDFETLDSSPGPASDTPPGIEGTETSSEPEFLDTSLEPEPEFLDTSQEPKPEFLDTSLEPEPEFLDTSLEPEPEFLDTSLEPEPEFLDTSLEPETESSPELAFESPATSPEPEFYDISLEPEPEYPPTLLTPTPDVLEVESKPAILGSTSLEPGEASPVPETLPSAPESIRDTPETLDSGHLLSATVYSKRSDDAPQGEEEMNDQLTETSLPEPTGEEIPDNAELGSSTESSLSSSDHTPTTQDSLHADSESGKHSDVSLVDSLDLYMGMIQGYCNNSRPCSNVEMFTKEGKPQLPVFVELVTLIGSEESDASSQSYQIGEVGEKSQLGEVRDQSTGTLLDKSPLLVDHLWEETELKDEVREIFMGSSSDNSPILFFCSKHSSDPSTPDSPHANGGLCPICVQLPQSTAVFNIASKSVLAEIAPHVDDPYLSATDADDPWYDARSRASSADSSADSIADSIVDSSADSIVDSSDRPLHSFSETTPDDLLMTPEKIERFIANCSTRSDDERAEADKEDKEADHEVEGEEMAEKEEENDQGEAEMIMTPVSSISTGSSLLIDLCDSLEATIERLVQDLTEYHDDMQDSSPEKDEEDCHQQMSPTAAVLEHSCETPSPSQEMALHGEETTDIKTQLVVEDLEEEADVMHIDVEEVLTVEETPYDDEAIPTVVEVILEVTEQTPIMIDEFPIIDASPDSPADGIMTFGDSPVDPPSDLQYTPPPNFVDCIVGSVQPSAPPLSEIEDDLSQSDSMERSAAAAGVVLSEEDSLTDSEYGDDPIQLFADNLVKQVIIETIDAELGSDDDSACMESFEGEESACLESFEGEESACLESFEEEESGSGPEENLSIISEQESELYEEASDCSLKEEELYTNCEEAFLDCLPIEEMLYTDVLKRLDQLQLALDLGSGKLERNMLAGRGRVHDQSARSQDQPAPREVLIMDPWARGLLSDKEFMYVKRVLENWGQYDVRFSYGLGTA